MSSLVTVKKWGNSLGVRIPKSVVDSLNLKINDELEISADLNSLTLKKVKQDQNRMTLQDFFKNYQPSKKVLNLSWNTLRDPWFDLKTLLDRVWL